MGDLTGIPHLAGSLTLSIREFEEFRDIVAENKESELLLELGQRLGSEASHSSSLRRSKKESESAKNHVASQDWLVEEELEVKERRRRDCCWRCCCCCGGKKASGNQRTKSATAAIIAWDMQHCKNTEEFVGLMTMVTRNAEETGQGLQSILAKLSYLEDADLEVEKLSIAGSYLWLITYGMQHVAIAPESSTALNPESDPDEIQLHPNPRINTRLTETHEAYEEIGEIVQEWVPLAIDFLKMAKDLRQSAAELVNILQNRFRFKKNPFKDCPDVKPLEPPRKSLRVVPDMFPEPLTSKRHSTVSGGRGQRDHSLAIKWSPVVVLVQATPTSRWEVFSTLETPEKVELIAMFIQETLRLLNSCVKTFKRSIMPSDVVEQPGSERPSSILEVTCGMLHFAFSSRLEKLIVSGDEMESLGKTVEAFWVTVDTLYETTLKLSKLVNETRDIVRSCYIYSDNFYNWNLKNLDLFEHPKTSAVQDERMNKFVSRVVGKNNGVDVARFYSIADFTTSYYQTVLQRHPVSSHGVALMLECWDDLKNEPWGLMDNFVDQRKKGGGAGKSKNGRHFAVTYRASDD